MWTQPFSNFALDGELVTKIQLQALSAAQMVKIAFLITRTKIVVIVMWWNKNT